MKKRIVVVCPGRGTYTKETLGYLKQFGKHAKDFLADIDARRKELGEPTITDLDSAEVFKPQLHTKGEHASSLIYACSYADFTAIDRERFEIVAVTGNSMGWYLACAYGGSLDWASGFEVINTMGSMMKNEIIGGQVIYPICDGNWVKSKEQLELVYAAVTRVNDREGCEVHPSIQLGGYIVLGANKPGIAALLKELPAIENYPFQLINHAAFHTPLLADTSRRAFEILSPSLFQRPTVTLIDGRGASWKPYSTDVNDLYQYTIGHQVVRSYDFTRAISVALKEYAPDHVVLLGPGATLGGSIGQIMIENDWLGLKNKDQFSKLQAEKPFLISMGRPEQRALVVAPGL
jgi:[acyl-carrier-protein] S-malonyltransferase